MSDTTQTTWTCDRCGTQDETSVGNQPVGWTRIYMVKPPKAEHDHMNPSHGRADLCRQCTRSVRENAFSRLPEAVSA